MLRALNRWRGERSLRRKIQEIETRDPAERIATLFMSEQVHWEKFKAETDKAGLLTRMGLATMSMMPGRWPDGSDLSGEGMDVVTGITMSTKRAVGYFAEGALSENECKSVILTAFRILAGLGHWDQPLVYDALPHSWSDQTIEMLRSHGFEKEADRFQRGRDLEIRLHTTAGHALIAKP